MKKKKAKTKKQKIKKEIVGYPKQLQIEEFFKCPIWFVDEPAFVDDLNKASDKYIEESKKTLKPVIDKRNKKFGDKGDMGHVFHSTTLVGDSNFAGLQNYIGATAHNLLGEMGFGLLQKCGYKNLLKKVRDTTHYIHIGMVISLVFIF